MLRVLTFLIASASLIEACIAYNFTWPGGMTRDDIVKILVPPGMSNNFIANARRVISEIGLDPDYQAKAYSVGSNAPKIVFYRPLCGGVNETCAYESQFRQRFEGSYMIDAFDSEDEFLGNYTIFENGADNDAYVAACFHNMTNASLAVMYNTRMRRNYIAISEGDNDSADHAITESNIVNARSNKCGLVLGGNEVAIARLFTQNSDVWSDPVIPILAQQLQMVDGTGEQRDIHVS